MINALKIVCFLRNLFYKRNHDINISTVKMIVGAVFIKERTRLHRCLQHGSLRHNVRNKYIHSYFCKHFRMCLNSVPSKSLCKYCRICLSNYPYTHNNIRCYSRLCNFCYNCRRMFQYTYHYNCSSMMNTLKI